MFRLLSVLLTLAGVALVLLLSLRGGERRTPDKPVAREGPAVRPAPPRDAAPEEDPPPAVPAPPEERLEAHVAAIPGRLDWEGSRAATRAIARDLVADPTIRGLVQSKILRLERAGDRHAPEVIGRTGKAPGIPAEPLLHALWAAASDAAESTETRVFALDIWTEAVPDEGIPAALRALRWIGPGGLPEELRVAVGDAEETLRDRMQSDE